MHWLSDEHFDAELTDGKPYTPRGGARELFRCRHDEVLIEGPVSTGKTRAVLEKAHIAAEKYPRSRLVFVRQWRKALSESILPTFENHVVPDNHPILRGAGRSHRLAYEYPNGSVIVLGGLDNPSKVMSTEWDMACVFEATETDEDPIERLSGRCRNNVMPYQQLICECNPAAEDHWLNLRPDKSDDDGTPYMVRVLSRHRDNPFLFNDDGTETRAGAAYMRRINRYTGVMYDRLVAGKWVSAEGLFYPNFSRDNNICERVFEPVRKVYGVDVGFTHNFVVLEGLVDGDGRLHIAREFSKPGLVQTEQVGAIARMVGSDKDADVVVDSAEPGLVEALIRHGFNAIAAEKGAGSVVAGGHQVRDRISPAGDGRPRLTVDPGCTVTIRGFGMYYFKQRADGMRTDEPEKANDDEMDALRYMVRHIDGIPEPVALPDFDETPDEPREESVAAQYARMRSDPDFGFADDV